MQRPRDLSRDDLERIANELQQALFLHYDEATDSFLWDPAKEWSCADVYEAMGALLSEFAMVPEEIKPFQ